MSRRPPDPLRYYLDANLDGPELVRALLEGNVPCEAHRDYFPSDAADEAWIPEIASRGWVIVTRDFAIKRKPAERDAWMITKATVIMLRGERLSAQDMAGMLLAAHADGRVDNFISKRIAPMILYVNKDGEIHVHFGGERRGGRKK